MLLFDIGYNRGKYTNYFLKENTEGKSVGVEANPNLYSMVKETSPYNVEILNYLVCEKSNDTRTLFVDPNQDGASTASEFWMTQGRFKKGSKHLAENNVNWNTRYEVKTITLDDLIEEYGPPTVIKIDVEGYTLNVLQGLTKKVGKICFEWTEEGIENDKKCLSYLRDLGYTEFGCAGYFQDETPIRITADNNGDDPSIEPEWLSYHELLEELRPLVTPERRINYGMMFAR